jgi:hypothetical protein
MYYFSTSNSILAFLEERQLPLQLLAQRKEKLRAQKALEDCLKRTWPSREQRIVAWRPGSAEMEITHNGKLWFGSSELSGSDTTPRYWNLFGRYANAGALQIAVEINIATESNDRRVSGFFARDLETNTLCLMHDGGVGGGRRGIGRAAFLEWSSEEVIDVVEDSECRTRRGILVAVLRSKSAAADLGRFVEKVLAFKDAVVRGETSIEQAPQAQQTYPDYFDEPSGKRRRQRIKELEYISRHGEIVRALRQWRQQSATPSDRIVKDRYIDLGVQVRGRLTELYEVKTNCERQTLYGAIGQVLVHSEGGAESARRFLVLPRGQEIPDDVHRALQRASITLIRFEMTGDRVQIRS